MGGESVHWCGVASLATKASQTELMDVPRVELRSPMPCSSNEEPSRIIRAAIAQFSIRHDAPRDVGVSTTFEVHALAEPGGDSSVRFYRRQNLASMSPLAVDKDCRVLR